MVSVETAIFSGRNYVNRSSSFRMEKFIRLKDLLVDAQLNAEKFYGKDNIAAGTRLRKQMQDLRNLAQAISFEVGILLR